MSVLRNYLTCTRCGETWESRMAGRAVPCTAPGTCKGDTAEVRPATIDEIETYERMFVDW